MASEKMVTLNRLAVGVFHWNKEDEARIERNLVALNGETYEALRFCKNRNGRHNRVHLVIGEEDFVALFQNAAENGVFGEGTLKRLREITCSILERGASVQGKKADPFLEVIGIGDDGELTKGLEEQLYGEDPA